MRLHSFLLIIFSGLISCGTIAKQGIIGQLDWVTGNQMPGPDKKPASRTVVVREIHIYELLTLSDVEHEGVFITKVNKPLVKTAISDTDGIFKVSLPPGTYSVLVKEEAGLFANQYDQHNNIQPVIVKEKGFVQVAIKIDYEAAY